MSDLDVANAKLEVVAARERMLTSTHALQERLKPSTLANNAWNEICDTGEAVAGKVGRAAVQRPVVTGAAVAGLAALLAHKPLGRLVARLGGKR